LCDGESLVGARESEWVGRLGAEAVGELGVAAGQCRCDVGVGLLGGDVWAAVKCQDAYAWRGRGGAVGAGAVPEVAVGDDDGPGWALDRCHCGRVCGWLGCGEVAAWEDLGGALAVAPVVEAPDGVGEEGVWG
jgi:hypothetical protein